MIILQPFLMVQLAKPLRIALCLNIVDRRGPLDVIHGKVCRGYGVGHRLGWMFEGGLDGSVVLDVGVVVAVVPPAAALPLPHRGPVRGDEVAGERDPVRGELAAVDALQGVEPLLAPDKRHRPSHQ